MPAPILTQRFEVSRNGFLEAFPDIRRAHLDAALATPDPGLLYAHIEVARPGGPPHLAHFTVAAEAFTPEALRGAAARFERRCAHAFVGADRSADAFVMAAGVTMCGMVAVAGELAPAERQHSKSVCGMCLLVLRVVCPALRAIGLRAELREGTVYLREIYANHGALSATAPRWRQ